MKKLIVIFALLTSTIVLVECSPKVAKTTAAAPTATYTTAQVTAGQTVFTNNCGKCHGLKDPTKFTSKQWDKILLEMIPKAHLNADDGTLVTAYVHANAKQG